MFIDGNCTHQTQSLNDRQISDALKHLPQWQHDLQKNAITRDFKFNQYADGPLFAVQLAQMADQQDHHPDIHIYYKKCTVVFTTHSAKGVSHNDLICAAKTNQIFNKLQ